MSSIFIETTNEKQLTVEEYIRYIRIKDHIQQVLDNADIKEVLREAEESINLISPLPQAKFVPFHNLTDKLLKF